MSMPLWLQICCIVLCGILSALFSGLSLGIMMLDTLQLNLLILVSEKNKKEMNNAKNARKILPLRNNTNEILVTFITANIMVNSAFSLLLGELSGGLNSFIISTVFITIFGEIIPQSICSRHGLAIGGFFIPLIYCLRFFLYIFVKPVSILLDRFVGKDVLNTYDRKQLKALVDMHKNRTNILHEDEAKILISALEFSQYKVIHIMTDIDYVFGIDYDCVINYEILKKILKSGFSRIPVLNRNRADCIVGLFHIKDLINIWFGINKLLLEKNYIVQYKRRRSNVGKLQKYKTNGVEEEQEEQEEDKEAEEEKMITIHHLPSYDKRFAERYFTIKGKVYNLKKRPKEKGSTENDVHHTDDQEDGVNDIYNSHNPNESKINSFNLNKGKKKNNNNNNINTEVNEANVFSENEKLIHDNMQNNAHEEILLKKDSLTAEESKRKNDVTKEKTENEKEKMQTAQSRSEFRSTKEHINWLPSEIYQRMKREKNMEEIFDDLKNYIKISKNNDVEIPIKYILKHIGRYVYGVDYDENIWSLLNFFKSVNNHIVVVRKVIYSENEDPKYAHIGIITLEDVIEILLQEEISDEFDFKIIKQGVNIPDNFVWKNSTDSFHFVDTEIDISNNAHEQEKEEGESISKKEMEKDKEKKIGFKMEVDADADADADVIVDVQNEKEKEKKKNRTRDWSHKICCDNSEEGIDGKMTEFVIDTVKIDVHSHNDKTSDVQIESKKCLSLTSINYGNNSIINFLKENIYFKYIDTDLISSYIQNKKIEKINKNDYLLTENSFLNYAIILIKGRVRNAKTNSPIIEGQCFIALEALGPFNIIELFNNTIEKRISLLRHFEEEKEKKKKKFYIKKYFIKKNYWKEKTFDYKKKKKRHFLSRTTSGSINDGRTNIFVQKGVNILFRKWYTQHVYYNRTAYIAESPCEFLRFPKSDYMDMIVECYGNDKVDEVM